VGLCFVKCLSKTSCDEQRLAGDPLRIVRREEHSRGRDIVGLTNPAKRRLGFKSLAEIAIVESSRNNAFRYHHAGIDGVYPDLSRSEFLRQSARNRVDCSFGCVVNNPGRRRSELASEPMLMMLPPLGLKCLSAS
jgi:hypothetical protein